MPKSFKEAIPDVIKYITDNLTAQNLSSAIENTRLGYLTGPKHGNTPGILLGPFYLMYRWSKYDSRFPEETIITNANAKEALLAKLMHDSGNDKKSLKWGLLHTLIECINDAMIVKNPQIVEFLNMPPTNYTDLDVESLIEEIILHLSPIDKVPTQVAVILENYIRRNTPTVTWKEPESVLCAKSMLNKIKQHFHLDRVSDHNNRLLIGKDALPTIIGFLTIAENARPSEDQKNLMALGTRLSGYLDHLQDILVSNLTIGASVPVIANK